MWLCGIRTDQQAELPGRQGSGSISCHEHKSLWWGWWQPSSKPLQPIWGSWCGRYVLLRILVFFLSSEDSVDFKYLLSIFSQPIFCLCEPKVMCYYHYVLILLLFVYFYYFVCVSNPFSSKKFIVLEITFSVTQRHQLSQARGSLIPAMTTTLQIHSLSPMSLIHRNQGTLLKSPIRTQTSSLIQNPRSPGRGKEYDLLTWPSTCMLTTLTMKMRSSMSKNLWINFLLITFF